MTLVTRDTTSPTKSILNSETLQPSNNRREVGFMQNGGNEVYRDIIDDSLVYRKKTTHQPHKTLIQKSTPLCMLWPGSHTFSMQVPYHTIIHIGLYTINDFFIIEFRFSFVGFGLFIIWFYCTCCFVYAKKRCEWKNFMMWSWSN